MEFEGCDHCGPTVRAYVFAEINGSDLAYCGSCGTRFWDGIMKQGGHITHDFRYLITA